MICVSVAESTFASVKRALAGITVAEVRLDLCRLSDVDIIRIFSLPRVKLIATCRPPILNQERERLLTLAIQHGAHFVDIEREMPTRMRQHLMRKARRYGCKVILSYHAMAHTPAPAALRSIVRSLYRRGADLVKVSCHVRRRSDNAVLLGLLAEFPRLIVTGMGAHGRVTRILAPLLGSPLCYVARRRGRETAPGQLTVREMERIMKVLA